MAKTSYRQKFERIIFQYSYLWHLFWRHATWKKIKNLALSQYEMTIRRAKLKCHPPFLVIDPGTICNLKCPLCPTGLGLPGRKIRFLKFKEFKKIFDQLYEYAFVVVLYDWGEPFLNPEIFKIISYAQEKNVGTIIGSNFTTVQKKDIDNILSSGLEHLVLSIDGASPKIYSKYRRGGDFRKVIANVKELVEKKKALGKKTPLIRWQFLVTSFNEHEVDKAKAMGRKLGVDAVTFYNRLKPPIDYIRAYGDETLIEMIKEWLPRKHLEYRIDFSKPYPFKSPCKELWRSIAINSDGGVSRCLGLYEDEYDIGNLLKEPFAKIWNNKFFQASRRVFKKGASRKIETVCDRCTVYARPK